MRINNLRWIAGVAAALAVAGAGAFQASGGSDGVRHVHAGGSIQAAIDDARPGDTIVVAPGVYRENLSIRTDGITLRGGGSGPQGTVLEPPVTPHPTDCTEAGEVVGICIAGVFVQGRDELGAPVRHTTVSGFRVDGFSKFGIVAYNEVDTTISDSDVRHSGHFGIAAIEVKGVRIKGNHSHDNGQSGFYVADAAAADAVITGNTASANTRRDGIGMFIRDAAHGVVADNRVEGNCGGILVVDSAAPAPAKDWALRRNTVHANTAACAATDEVPVPLSGFGIALLGTSSTSATANDVTSNVPSGNTAIAGGIVLATAKVAGGPDPAGTVLVANQLSANAPADLVADGSGTGNRFAGNTCGTSQPAGICR